MTMNAIRVFGFLLMSQTTWGFQLNSDKSSESRDSVSPLQVFLSLEAQSPAIGRFPTAEEIDAFRTAGVDGIAIILKAIKNHAGCRIYAYDLVSTLRPRASEVAFGLREAWQTEKDEVGRLYLACALGRIDQDSPLHHRFVWRAFREESDFAVKCNLAESVILLGPEKAIEPIRWLSDSFDVPPNDWKSELGLQLESRRRLLAACHVIQRIGRKSGVDRAILSQLLENSDLLDGERLNLERAIRHLE